MRALVVLFLLLAETAAFAPRSAFLSRGHTNVHKTLTRNKLHLWLSSSSRENRGTKSDGNYAKYVGPLLLSSLLLLSSVQEPAVALQLMVSPELELATEPVQQQQPSQSQFPTSSSKIGTDTMSRSDRPIMDLSGVLDSSSKSILQDIIDNVQRDTQTEVQIVLVDEVQPGYSPKRMATTLFNNWRLGPADKNNGVLILAVLQERRIEIEVGSGLNSDMGADWCTQTLKEVAVPYFRQELYGTGLVETMDRIASRLRQIDTGTVPERSTQDLGEIVGPYITAGVATLFIGGLTLAWLDDTFPIRDSCPKCDTYRWTYENSNWETIVEATDRRDGRKRKQGVCANCGCRQFAYRDLPQYRNRAYDSDGRVYYYNRRDSDSDSGSSGGGSSDGGGGGASW